MDSCNSGSIQSSSGGDEESVSSFLGPASSLAFTPLRLHHPPPSAPSFGPLPRCLDAIARPPTPPPPPPPPQPPVSPGNSNPILNLGIPWARGLCSSDLCNCTDTGCPQVAPPPPPPRTFPPARTGNIATNSLPSPSSSSSHLLPWAAPATHLPDHTTAAAGGASGGALPRGSKKRARPSRRAAPTTVLVTDTSNFRAMVQEFTGGVPPLHMPFSSPAFPPSGRFDGLPAAASPAMAHSPVRPFAHKAPAPFLSNASLSFPPATSIATDTVVAAPSTISANTSVTRPIAPNTAAVTAPVSSNRTATCSSYQLPTIPFDHSLGNRQYNTLNLFSFQSLMQPSHEYGSLDVANLVMEKRLQGVTSSEGYAISGGARLGHASTVVSEGTSTSLRGGSSDGGSGDVPWWVGGSSSADRGG